MQIIEDGEVFYGVIVKVLVFLMMYILYELIEKDGVMYFFVVDDIVQVVVLVKQVVGEKLVSLFGGSILWQCFVFGFVDEIYFDVVLFFFGDGILFFGGFGMCVLLECIEMLVFVSEMYFRYCVVLKG